MQDTNGVRKRLQDLADQITSERDQDKFMALIREFNELLEGNQKPREPANPSYNA
jgi:hypothetical protein